MTTTSKTKIKKKMYEVVINHQNVVKFKHKIFIDTSVSIFFLTFIMKGFTTVINMTV